MGRIEAWAAGLRMLRSSPIWGVGSGMFLDHHERAAHNSFVQCFAETGLVGYFLWLGLIVVSLIEMSRLGAGPESSDWARWAHAVQASLLTFLVGAFFLSRTTSAMLFLLTGLTAAVATVARREGEEVRAEAWARRALGIEVVSIVTIWLTSRAAW
jgi:O-antigen ligase